MNPPGGDPAHEVPPRVDPEDAAGLARPPRAAHRLLVLALLLAGTTASVLVDALGLQLTGGQEAPPAWFALVQEAGHHAPYLAASCVVVLGLLRAGRQDRRWRRRRPGLAARTFGGALSPRQVTVVALLLFALPLLQAALVPGARALDRARWLASPWPMLTLSDPVTFLLLMALVSACGGVLCWVWLRGGATVVTAEHAVVASPFGLGAAVVPLARCRPTQTATGVTLIQERRLPRFVRAGDRVELLGASLVAERPAGPSVVPLRRLILIVVAPVVLVIGALAGIDLSRSGVGTTTLVGLVTAPACLLVGWALLRRAGAGAVNVDVGAGALAVDEQLVPWSWRPRVALARGWLVVEARRTRVAAWVGAAGAGLAPELEARLAPATLARALPAWAEARRVRGTALLCGAALVLALGLHELLVPERAVCWPDWPHGAAVQIWRPFASGPRCWLIVDARRASDGALLPVTVDPRGRWVERGGVRFDVPPWATLGLLAQERVAFEVGPPVKRPVLRPTIYTGVASVVHDDARPLARVIQRGEQARACMLCFGRAPGELTLAASVDRGASTFVAFLPPGFRWPDGEGCVVCRLAALHPGRALRARGPTVLTGRLPDCAQVLAAFDELEGGTASVTSVAQALVPGLFPDLPPARRAPVGGPPPLIR